MREFYSNAIKYKGSRSEALTFVRDRSMPALAAYGYKIKEDRPDGVVVSRRVVPNNVLEISAYLVVIAIVALVVTAVEVPIVNVLAAALFVLGVILASVVREEIETTVVVEECPTPADDAAIIRVSGYPDKRSRGYFEALDSPREPSDT